MSTDEGAATHEDGERGGVTIHIRRATPDDAEGIAAMGERVTRATHLGFVDEVYVQGMLATWWRTGAIRESMTRTVHHVAHDDEGVVGTSVLGRLDGEPVLWKLYVDVGLHGSGVGSQLLDAALGHVEDGDSCLRLSVLEGNAPALAFYLRRGFVETGREPDPLGATNIWMARPLP